MVKPIPHGKHTARKVDKFLRAVKSSSGRPLSKSDWQALEQEGLKRYKSMSAKEMEKAGKILAQKSGKGPHHVAQTARTFFSDNQGKTYTDKQLGTMDTSKLKKLEDSQTSMDQASKIRDIRITKEINSAGNNIDELKNLLEKTQTPSLQKAIKEKIARLGSANVAYSKDILSPGQKPTTSRDVLEAIIKGEDPDNPQENVIQPVSSIYDLENKKKNEKSKKEDDVTKNWEKKVDDLAV